MKKLNLKMFPKKIYLDEDQLGETTFLDFSDSNEYDLDQYLLDTDKDDGAEIVEYQLVGIKKIRKTVILE
jgi:hypothetical protein